MVQVFTISFPPVCDLCSFSQIFASRSLQTLLKLSSYNYLKKGPRVSSNLEVRCFQFHAHAFLLLLFFHIDELFLYLSLWFLISVLIFSFCSLFSLCLTVLASNQTLILFLSTLPFSRNAHLFLSPQSLTLSTSLSQLVSFTPFSKNLSFSHCLRSLP